jgi:hypothetical protein
MAESRTYDLRDFDIVAVSTGVRAILTTGGDYSVRVEAPNTEILDRVDVSAAGGRLHIGIGRGFFDFVFGGGLVEMLKHGGGFNITAYITLPPLNGTEASSGARIEASNVKSDRFHGEATSGAQLTLLGVSGGNFRAEASSGGRIEIEGAIAEFDADVSSGGQIRADRLSAQRGRLEASSGGHVETTVTSRVRATASSGGPVRVNGNPAERDDKTTNGGNLSV